MTLFKTASLTYITSVNTAAGHLLKEITHIRDWDSFIGGLFSNILHHILNED